VDLILQDGFPFKRRKIVTPAFGGLTLTVITIVIARSEATKQSRYPTQRVGECVGEANLVIQPKGLENVLAKPISLSNPKGWRMCWRSQSRIEIATLPLREARNDKKPVIAMHAFGELASMGIVFC